MSPSDDPEIQHNPEEKIFRDIFDIKLPDAEEDRGFADRIHAIFTGKSRKTYYLMMAIYTAILGVTLWVGFHFYRADILQDTLFWGVNLLLCGVVIVAFELWFWMEMNRNSMLREVKRLELQISLLRQEATQEVDPKN
ncbi:DUF6768 family protein [Paremcibacter congregatus]|uniref:DUF6768 family protein n=1 Tax=Paremcibacter congregatus TaxID=2043170 RepID=UPI003A941CDF